jgi:beta-galactosidase
VLVQLDNEMGMIHWVRNIIDTNPDTLDRFGAWLREFYGTALNDRYPIAELTSFLQAQLTAPDDAHGARVLEDYRRFFRDYLRRYVLHLWERARADGMDAPPVLNIHGFTNTSGGRTFPIGLSQLVEVMEIDGMVSATDVYPLHIGEGNFDQLLMVNEMTKALQNPAQPLFSIEFQSGGNQDFSGVQSSYYDLHSRLCISVGMRAINHYLFFAGKNDPILSPIKRHDWGPPVRNDGSVRRHYSRYGELSRALNAYGTDLVRARPKTVTTIGFALDDFMTEVNNAATRSATDVITHQREVILFDFLARGLALTHRPFDAVELARARLDPETTPLLWVMLDQQCDARVQQKLLDYANAGGRLVVVGRLCAETRDHVPCTILQDGLGVRSARREPPFTEALITAFDDVDIPVTFLETYEGEFDEVFATSAAGETVGFLRRVGKGYVMMLGAALPAHTLDDLRVLDRMAERMDCPPLFTLGEWADVRVSEGERGNFLFAANYLDDPIDTTIVQSGVALLGGHTLLLPARRGLILPLEWQLRPGVLVHYLTAEVRAVTEDDTGLTLTTAPAEFHAELTLDGYHADDALIVARSGERVTVRGMGGVLQLQKG